MKKIIFILSLALVAMGAFAQYVDDMYDTSPAKPKKQQTTTYSASEQTPRNNANSDVAPSPTDNKELITSYQEALQRRLSALRNDVDMDEAYWQLMQQYQSILETKYDNNLYNIVVVGNDMWVEPQSITALFNGEDPADGVIKYNEQIKKKLIGGDTKLTSSGGGISGGGSSSPTIVFNITVDPWAWSGWGYNSWMPHYGYFGYNSYYDPWYNPWRNPWYNSWYRPYYDPWYQPYYPVYRSNPRGTYYGNSSYRNSHNESGGGMGGGRQPRIAGATDGRFDRRGLARPTGANTVSGLSNRFSRSEVRSRGETPIGGVADLRNAGVTIDRGENTGIRIQNGRGSNYTRPTMSTDNRSTYIRPSTNDNNTRYQPRQRSTYERPVERPSTPTYQRPTPTYDRPAPSTYSRPSGGGSTGGGGNRPMGGGRGR